jgi:tetratricopeptide (TPR) repeat protein
LGALPRPDIPPGSQRELVDALHALHHTAGWPSLRHLAREVGASPTTISVVFSAPRLPSWGLLSLVVEALDGDEEEFRQLWLAASAPAESPSHVALGIAGRREDLAVVRRHLESGTGLLLVVGEAGIGKTKLVDTARATSEGFVARGAGLPLSVEVPFLPFSRALHEILRADDDWLNRALDACPPYVRASLAPLLPELTSVEEQAPSLDASARSRLFKAASTLLVTLAEDRPLAWLIDDLHWADGDTLDLVEQLLSAGEGVPLLGTFRTDDPGIPDRVAAWSARVRRLGNVETLELAALNRAETGEQVRLLCARGPHGTGATESLVDRIYERSRGQPLFTEQLAAQPDGSLPRLLDDVLGQRVEDLPGDEHRVVAVLAVADRGLPVGQLQSATGLPPTTLIACLRTLADRRLLADHVEMVTLRHPLLAETIRRHLVPGEAAEVHRVLAATLVEDGEPAEIAAHWQGAGDAAEELSWRIRAARTAHTRIAASEEARQWQRALELWPDGDLTEWDGLRRIDAELAHLDAVEGSGDTLRAWDLVVPALDRVDDLQATLAAEVWVRAATYAAIVGGALPAVEYAERAVTLYGDAPPSPAVVRALVQYGLCLNDAGRLGEALEVLRRVVTVCRALGDAIELRLALVIYAVHLSHLAWSDEVRALLDEAHSIVTPRPDPAGDVRLSFVETDIVLRFGGGPEALIAAGRGGLAAAEEWHLHTFRAFGVRSNVADGLLRAGRVAEAAQLVDPYTEGSNYVEAHHLFGVRVALDVVRGRLKVAEACLEALELALPWVAENLEATALVVPCELWSGRPDLAWERLRLILEAETGNDRVSAGECQVLLVRAAADLADSPGADRDLWRPQVLDILAGDDPTDMASEAQRAHRAARTAELARLAGDPQPNLWVAAAKEWDAIGRRFETAYACWRGAQAARAAGRGTDANRLLQRAAKLAQGHVPLTEAIRAASEATPSG